MAAPRQLCLTCSLHLGPPMPRTGLQTDQAAARWHPRSAACWHPCRVLLKATVARAPRPAPRSFACASWPAAGRIWYDSPFIGIAECYEPDSGRAVGRTVLDTTVKGAGALHGSLWCDCQRRRAGTDTPAPTPLPPLQYLCCRRPTLTKTTRGAGAAAMAAQQAGFRGTLLWGSASSPALSPCRVRSR